jgi:hypothetical protein
MQELIIVISLSSFKVFNQRFVSVKLDISHFSFHITMIPINAGRSKSIMSFSQLSNSLAFMSSDNGISGYHCLSPIAFIVALTS